HTRHNGRLSFTTFLFAFAIGLDFALMASFALDLHSTFKILDLLYILLIA
ncbi:MAG: hypothetical protein ACI9PN_002271, partial [Candidatus Azotimanducaceae bacterium]